MFQTFPRLHSLLFIFIFSFTTSSAFAQNLVKNPSFENMPDLLSWTSFKNGEGGAGTIEIARDSGNRVLHIKNDAGSNIGVTQTLDFPAPYNSDSFEISYRLKLISKEAGALVSLGVGITYVDDTQVYYYGSLIGKEKDIGKWVEKSVLLYPAKAVKKVNFLLLNYNKASESYYDDVRVTRSNLVQNGGFEESPELVKWAPFVSGNGSPGQREIINQDNTHILHVTNQEGNNIGLAQTIIFKAPYSKEPFELRYRIKLIKMAPGAFVTMGMITTYEDDSTKSHYGSLPGTQKDIGKWVEKQSVINNKKPVKSINLFILNYNHPSEAYFDNVLIRRLEEPTLVKSISNDTTTISLNSWGDLASIKYMGKEKISEAYPMSKIFIRDLGERRSRSITPLGTGRYLFRYFGSAISILIEITPEKRRFIFKIIELNNPENEPLDSVDVFQFPFDHPVQKNNQKDWAVAAGPDELFIHALPLTVQTHCEAGTKKYICGVAKKSGFDNVAAVLITTPKKDYFSSLKSLILDYNLPMPLVNGLWFRETLPESYLFARFTHENYQTLLGYARLGKFRQAMMISPFVYGMYNQPTPNTFDDFSQLADDLKSFFDPEAPSEKIHLGIHTFINHIAPGDPLLTADNIFKINIGKLKSAISSTSTTINVDRELEKDTKFSYYKNAAMFGTFVYLHTFVIGNEIISANIEGSKLINVTRGKFNSPKSNHAANAKLHLVSPSYGGFFFDPDSEGLKTSVQSFAQSAKALQMNFLYADGNMFVRDFGSEKKGDSYNEEKGLLPYLAAFPDRPVVQYGGYSSAYATYYRNRSASQDGPVFQSKAFTKQFKAQIMLDTSPYAYVKYEMGWWKINGAKMEVDDFDATTEDDVHFAMSRVFAFDSSIGLQLGSFYDSNKQIESLLKLVARYHDLMRQERGIVPDEMKLYLQNLDNEAELIEDDEGELFFVKKKVAKKYLHWEKGKDASMVVEDPYGVQRYSLMLRPRFDYYSFDDPRHLLLTDFKSVNTSNISSDIGVTCTLTKGVDGMHISAKNSNTRPGKCTISIPLAKVLSLTHKRGLGLQVTGDGNNATVIVRIGSNNAGWGQHGVRNYQFNTDFVGQKELTLGYSKGGYFGDLSSHWTFDFSKVDTVTIFINDISSDKSHEIGFSLLKGLEEKRDSEIRDPTITLNDRRIVFDGIRLAVDDRSAYSLRYDGENKRLSLYDSNGGEIAVPDNAKIRYPDGEIQFSEGLNRVRVSSDTSDPEYSTRAELWITSRDEIKKPEVVVGSDMGSMNMDGGVNSDAGNSLPVDLAESSEPLEGSEGCGCRSIQTNNGGLGFLFLIFGSVVIFSRRRNI